MWRRSRKSRPKRTRRRSVNTRRNHKEVITKLVQEEGFAQSLFADADALEKESRLSSSIDSINKLYGRGTVLLGAQGTGEIKMSREHQSPHYTTLWEDLPKTSVH